MTAVTSCDQLRPVATNVTNVTNVFLLLEIFPEAFSVEH